MQKTCIVDGVKFEAKRASAKYCSEKCRKAASREPLPAIGTAGPVGQAASRELTSEERDLKLRADKLGIPLAEAKRRIAAFEKMGLQRVSWITSGIPELDDFQQIPRGRVTQIQGPYAVGKTTLALNMIKGLADKKVLYIDSEASLNPQLIFDLGLSDKNFHLYNESAYIEDMYDQTILAAKSGQYDMIIIDSLAGCTTKTEEAGTATDRNIGQKALIVNKLMRIVPMELKNSDTALVIINQEREVIGSYVPQKYTPGGMGPIYASSLILGLKTIPSWRFPKDAKEGRFEGHEIEVTIIKSKVSQPHRKKKIKLFYVNPEAEIKGQVGVLRSDLEDF